MKKTNILSAGILAVAAGVLLAPSARAQGTTTYTPGDLILGFEDQASPGNSYNYIVDLGPATEFTTLAQRLDATTNLTTTLGLGNIAADLTTAFGSNWATNGAIGTNVQWGVFGSSGNSGPVLGIPEGTLFLTQAETTPGTQSAAPVEKSEHVQNGTIGEFISFVSSGFDNQPVASSTVGTIIPSSGTYSPGANSWTQQDPSSGAFGLSYGVEQLQDASNLHIGPTNSELDLYELLPTNNGGTGRGVDLGSLTLDSSGDLEFSTAVPEPSTYASIGIGAAFLLTFRRIRKPFLV